MYHEGETKIDPQESEKNHSISRNPKFFHQKRRKIFAFQEKNLCPKSMFIY